MLYDQKQRAWVSNRIYLSALLGVFLEYFDYTLYGFSVPYIAASFFPNEKTSTDLVLTWAIFAMGFVLRPLGALVFGHLADKVGRRLILTFSILLMSLATVAMGLLPTYQKVGIAAPILLIVCRILQGLAVSTEYSGCSTYLLEFRKMRKGLVSGVITSASGFGVFGASLLALLFNTSSFSFPFIANWRWPFIIAGLTVGFLGFYLRRTLSESPCFLEAQQQRKLVHFPLLQLLRKYKAILFKSLIISAYTGISIILIEVYLSSYLQTYFGMPKEKALQLSTYLALLEACFAIFWGSLSDYIGCTQTMWIAGLMMIFGVFPLLDLFHLPHPILWFVAATCLALIVGAIDGPLAAFLTSNFPTEIRYSGVSLSYNLGVAIIGGLSPGLLELLKNQFHAVNVLGWYLMFGACSMLACLAMRWRNKQ